MRNTARIALGIAFLGSSLFASGLLPKAPEPPAKIAALAPEDRVDINAATIDQLMKVPGMTRTWAARIIRFRPYHAKNELIDRGIVTSQVYDRIRDFIIAHRPAR